jgi:hypothetical protein
VPRTPEQRAADDALTEAIDRVAKIDFPPDGDPGLLVDFVVVAQYTMVADDGDGVDAYYLQFPNGSMPDHRALGLLHWGINSLVFGARVKRGEGEDD